MTRRAPTSLREVVARRATPGLLVLDGKGRLLSLNHEARRVLAWGRSGNPTLLTDYEGLIPPEVGQWRRRMDQNGDEAVPGLVYKSGRRWYFARRLDLDVKPGEPNGFIGVLLERISELRVPVARVGPQYRLSRRELEIVTGITRGQRDKEIARDLGISFHTVRASLRTIRAKLRVNTRTGIIAKLLEPTISA